MNPPETAITSAGTKRRHATETCPAYDLAAHAVPQTIADFVVPKILGSGASGKTLSMTGSETSPPPPAIAFTKPPKNDPTRINTISNVVIQPITPHFSNSLCMEIGRSTEQTAQGHPIFPHDGGEHPAEDTETKYLQYQILVSRLP